MNIIDGIRREQDHAATTQRATPAQGRQTMNFDADEIKAAVVEAAARQIADDETMWDMVKRDLNARADKLFAERAEAQIAAAVDAAIKDGFERPFCRVDNFGKPTGEPTTISRELERLVGNYWSEMVDRNGKPSTSYGSATRAEFLMSQIAAEDFSKQMKAAAVSVTAAMKDGFRAQLARHVDSLLDDLFRVKSIQDQGKAEKPW